MKTKLLSDADLGLAESSHQTHIGLLSDMVKNVSATEETFDAYLYLDKELRWLECFANIKGITRQSGAVEAPRLKSCSSKVKENEDLYKLIRKYGNETIRYLTLGSLPDNKIIAILHGELPNPNISCSVQVFSNVQETPNDSGSYQGSNTIYFGPPGTGKSTKIDALTARGHVFRTQFHPEYTHSDFMGCYRPVVGTHKDPSKNITDHEGNIAAGPVNYFSFVPGPFIDAFCQALKTEDPVYLIIEEINRGNCAAIFGEIFQLLDRDATGKSKFSINQKAEITEYFNKKGLIEFFNRGGRLEIPSNLSIFATMNTSDQSLFPMDSAFKRRWQWVSCPIDNNELIKFTGGQRPYLDDGKNKWDWIKFLENLNKKIVQDRMEDKQIGPWFIKPEKNGSVSWDEFLNKVLFYLWHDVFKDEQASSEHSPFICETSTGFSDIQKNIRVGGLAAGFKNEILPA